MSARLGRPPSVPPSSYPSSSPSSGLPHYRLIERIPEVSGSRVTVAAAGRELTLRLPLPGEAAALDFTAALAAQEAASREMLSADAIERALAGVRLVGRGLVRTLANDVVVLDDTYNANPASMRAALSTLAELAGARRRVAVLGEMKELGALAEQEHAALGDAIADAGVKLAIGCGGPLIGLALDRASARGIEVVRCADTADASAVASTQIRSGDTVLIKGSRSTRTEDVLAALERS